MTSRPETSQRENRPSVLLIDDDPGILDFLRDAVGLLGYAPIIAMTGVAGLAILRERVPDAVLLDINMPGALGGFDALKAIKAARPGLPVIMVTANIDPEIAQATLRDGALDYIMKPLTIDHLREVLTAALLLSGKLPPDSA